MPNLNGDTKLIALAEAATQIKTMDQLQFRRSGFNLIAVAGRTQHTHSAKAAWWDGDLFCLEVRELKGGRAVTLRSQVEKFPARIDVFETNPHGMWSEYDRDGAAKHMRQLAGCDYGYGNIVAAAMLHLPFLRLIATPDFDDLAKDDRPPFCSHACAMADRIGGGVDPVPNLADRLTEPAELSRSPFYRYKFTLIP